MPGEDGEARRYLAGCSFPSPLLEKCFLCKAVAPRRESPDHNLSPSSPALQSTAPAPAWSQGSPRSCALSLVSTSIVPALESRMEKEPGAHHEDLLG